MEEAIEKVNVIRIIEKDGNSIEDVVAREFPLTIILNNQELVTLLCSPVNLSYLAIGFLFSEGLLTVEDRIRKIIIDDNKGIVRVETEGEKELDKELFSKRIIASGCGRGASFYSATDTQSLVKVESDIEISTSNVFALMNEFQHRSQVYRATGGVHSAALCDAKEILIFSEDIGRHNALDKIFGECMLNGIQMDDHIIISSGRVSSEMVLKLVKRNIPVIISKSAPTSLGLRLADDLGVTLVGFVRGKRMNVYTHDWRITIDGK